MRDIRFQIVRSADGKCFLQEYRLPHQPRKTIIWWLTRIQEELDSSLAFPVSCRAGLCGGCGLMINNKSVLACETMPDSYLSEGEDVVTIKPLQSFPVIRDLLIDWIPARERMKQLIPWSHSERNIDIQMDIRLKPDVCKSLMNLGSCITCGVCVSECPAMKSGPFIEPYVFVKCQKILVDSRVREDSKQSIIRNLRPYLNYCLECGKCKEACPRGLSPAAAVKFVAALNQDC
jgi:succinate dehydrogenase/fumarate reductase iron-sulfur protein